MTGPADLPIPGLPVDVTVNYLAVMGISHLLSPEQATIHFDGLTPVLRLDVSVDPAVEHVSGLLADRALDAAAHPAIPLQSNLRQEVNTHLRASWGDPDPVLGLRVDSTSVKEPTKYARGTRFATAVNHPLSTKLKAFDTRPREHYRDLVRELFETATPHPTPCAKSLLGLSPTDDSEAVRYAGSTKYLYEAAELLAGSAIPYLAPRATFRDPDHARTHRWLRWHLNTTPMTWHGLLALGRRDRVPGLDTYESELKAGSSGKYYRYTPTVLLTDRPNRSTP